MHGLRRCPPPRPFSSQTIHQAFSAPHSPSEKSFSQIEGKLGPGFLSFLNAPSNHPFDNDAFESKAFANTLDNIDDDDMPNEAHLFADWLRDSPYKTDKRERLLTMRIIDAIDAHCNGTEQTANIPVEAWEALNEQERYALTQMAQYSNVGTQIAADILNALEHLLVVRAARDDPCEDNGLTWKEYRIQTAGLFNELHDKYERTFVCTRNPYGTYNTVGDLNTAYQMTADDSHDDDAAPADDRSPRNDNDFYEQDGSEPEEDNKEESDDGPWCDA